ncbi:MAG: hypothetical protein A2177_10060 [Spirochaetes bacterium RBG_13_68_11]|nr:MAG: hypothetical protein A2177_10060 [Spirochaetes bacterium RBG_13_68_11]
MGATHPFVPEQLVVAVLSSRPSSLPEARKALEERFGPVAFASDPIPWSFTTYYDREMGPGIVRLFWAFARLVDPAELPSIKLTTNGIEDEFREDGSRKLNLDPGLLSLSRFVLATTKDGSHRIPLRDGIYAEVTLVFERGEFRPLPWTYPDYRSDGVRAVLKTIRDRYRERSRQG